jgi:hypothetical protein
MVRLAPVDRSWRDIVGATGGLITIGVFLLLHAFVFPSDWDVRALLALAAVAWGGAWLWRAYQELRHDEATFSTSRYLLAGAFLVPVGVYLAATAVDGWRFLGGGGAAILVYTLLEAFIPEEAVDDDVDDDENALRKEQQDEELLRSPRAF